MLLTLISIIYARFPTDGQNGEPKFDSNALPSLSFFVNNRITIIFAFRIFEERLQLQFFVMS